MKDFFIEDEKLILKDGLMVIEGVKKAESFCEDEKGLSLPYTKVVADDNEYIMWEGLSLIYLRE